MHKVVLEIHATAKQMMRIIFLLRLHKIPAIRYYNLRKCFIGTRRVNALAYDMPILFHNTRGRYRMMFRPRDAVLAMVITGGQELEPTDLRLAYWW